MLLYSKKGNARQSKTFSIQSENSVCENMLDTGLATVEAFRELNLETYRDIYYAKNNKSKIAVAVENFNSKALAALVSMNNKIKANLKSSLVKVSNDNNALFESYLFTKVNESLTDERLSSAMESVSIQDTFNSYQNLAVYLQGENKFGPEFESTNEALESLFLPSHPSINKDSIKESYQRAKDIVASYETFINNEIKFFDTIEEKAYMLDKSSAKSQKALNEYLMECMNHVKQYHTIFAEIGNFHNEISKVNEAFFMQSISALKEVEYHD